jgi:CheY-specific phosphatase CheX
MKCIRVLLVVAAMLFGAMSAHAQPVSGQGTWESTLQARDIGNIMRGKAVFRIKRWPAVIDFTPPVKELATK